MLAHGESQILPAVVLLLGLFGVLYPASIWIFLKALRGNRSQSLTIFAVAIVIVSAVGVISTVNHKPPFEAADLAGVLFWIVPLACALAALLRARRVS